MLYGTIYGDIAGSKYEFRSVKDYNFVSVPRGSHFTDDTVMTLAVAKWLMREDCSLDTLVEEMQDMGRRYPRAGYGGMFRHWLAKEDPKPYNSFGNGSAMRVAPCAWVSDQLEEVESLAEASAIVTHNHPEGIKGAKATAAAIWMARNNYEKDEIKDYITKKYGYNLDRTIQEIKDSGYRFDSTCQGSVPEAIIAFLEGDDFDEVIRLAIYLGGDADTQAAIAGSIAEAFYDIPNKNVEIAKKHLDPYLINIVKDFNRYCHE